MESKSEAKERKEISQNDQGIEDEDQIEEKKDPTDFLCTPYEFSNKSDKEVDYNKLIEQFGTKPITKDLLEEFQRLTGEVPHILLRRGSIPLTIRNLFLT